MTKNEKMFKVGAVLLEVSEYQNTKLLLCVRVYYAYVYNMTLFEQHIIIVCSHSLDTL